MPIIKVELFPGRTNEQKRQLVRKLTDTYVEVLGGRPQAVQVILQDVAKNDWGVGGELCSDLYPDPVAATASSSGASE